MMLRALCGSALFTEILQKVFARIFLDTHGLYRRGPNKRISVRACVCVCGGFDSVVVDGHISLALLSP